MEEYEHFGSRSTCDTFWIQIAGIERKHKKCLAELDQVPVGPVGGKSLMNIVYSCLVFFEPNLY